MNGPSARQSYVHGVLVRHAGNASAASRELGVSETAVRTTERRYLEATGGPPMPRPKTPGALMQEVPARLDAIEARVATILEAEARRDATLEELVELIREINGRQPLILVERYATHRRQADGGAGGKAERSPRRERS